MKISFFYGSFLVFLCVFGIQNLYAGPEEDACFDILTKKTLSIYGFDLTKVRLGSVNKNISTYDNFKINKHKTSSNPNGLFISQRNNIGTIILPTNYITTQYVPIGNDTSFYFPTDSNGDLIGDQLTEFKNQMVYTHHLSDEGSLLSCGYLKITPYNPYDYMDLDPSNYYTNIIDGGGFEIESSQSANFGSSGIGHFIVGKSVVQGAARLGDDTDTEIKLQKLFKIDIINVVYDNSSSYFNEYETYPLQVDTMTNPDALSSVFQLKVDFMNRVMNQTCLSSVHPTISTLPAICNGNYASRSSQVRSARSFASQGIPVRVSQESFFTDILSFFIPQASAALEKEEMLEIQAKKSKSNNQTGGTVMIDPNFDYFQYQKIESLPSKALQKYIMSATSHHNEMDIQKLVASGSTLSEYESVLLGCGISYADRVALIKKWIDSIDIANFSTYNIEYPDPKIGDCVIPFPDKRHADKVIPGSFESNQQYARYINNNTGEHLDTRIDTLKSQFQEIEKEYISEIQKANTLIKSGKVTEGRKLFNEISAIYESKIQKNQKDMTNVLNPGINHSINLNTYLSYGMIFFGLFLCLMIVFVLRRNKSQQIPKP